MRKVTEIRDYTLIVCQMFKVAFFLKYKYNMLLLEKSKNASGLVPVDQKIAAWMCVLVKMKYNNVWNIRFLQWAFS